MTAPADGRAAGELHEALASVLEVPMADYGRAAFVSGINGLAGHDDPAVEDAAVAVFVAHRAAVQTAYAAGRADAFAEVTAAIEALALGAWNGSMSVSGIGERATARWSAGSSKTKATDDLVRVTPIAAIMAAAATVQGRAEAAP